MSPRFVKNMPIRPSDRPRVYALVFTSGRPTRKLRSRSNLPRLLLFNTRELRDLAVSCHSSSTVEWTAFVPSMKSRGTCAANCKTRRGQFSSSRTPGDRNATALRYVDQIDANRLAFGPPSAPMIKSLTIYASNAASFASRLVVVMELHHSARGAIVRALRIVRTPPRRPLLPLRGLRTPSLMIRADIVGSTMTHARHRLWAPERRL